MAKFQQFINNEAALPFDQHFFKAPIAPCVLLTTEAQDDIWANPTGTMKTHQAALPVFDLLGVKSNIHLHSRAGGHAHTVDDWRYLLNFCSNNFTD